jgi:hypothetical protein
MYVYYQTNLQICSISLFDIDINISIMSTLNQRLEQIIVNIKVIAKLEPNQRLIFKNKSISIRNYYVIITPTIRTISGESRSDITEGLSNLLDDVNRLITDYCNSFELQHPNANVYDRELALAVFMLINRLKIEIPSIYNSGGKGLNAIKQTYLTDPETSSKIEGIIDNFKIIDRKINVILDDMGKKYDFDNLKSGKHMSHGDSD